jgi:hypothetical protein
MNKTKKVAWHKHLARARKLKEKSRVAAAQKSPASATSTRRS